MDHTVRQVNVDLEKSSMKKVLIGTLCLLFTDFFFSLCIAICLPNILVKLGYTNLYTIIVVVRSVESALGMLVAGTLGNIFGRKNLVKILVPVLIISAIVCGLAFDIVTFLIAIVILGFVNGILMTTGFTIISDITEAKERGQYFGYVTTVINISMVFTPFIAGVLTDLKVPGYTFWIPVPFAICAYVLLTKYFENKVFAKGDALDYLGFVLITAAVSMVITILTIGGKQVAWLSPMVIALAIASILDCAYLFRYLKRKKNPIVDISVFNTKSYNIGSIINVLKMPYTTILTVYMILYVQQVLGASATISGLINLPKTIATILLPTFFGLFIQKQVKKQVKGKTYQLLVGSMIVTLIGCLIMTLGLNFDQALLFIFVASAVLGLAESMQAVTLSPYSLSEVPPEKLGAANSMMNFIPAITSSVVTAIFGSIVTLNPDGISGALPVMGIIAIVTTAISLVLSATAIPKDI